jgi:hypothetical protein
VSVTPSPTSTIEIVRQTSVGPGLEDTESAVWNVAQRDSIISFLPQKEQIRMIHAALSLGSEEGMKELRRFLSNAGEIGMRGSQSLMSDIKLTDPRLGSNVGHAKGTIVSRDSALVHFSALYQHLDILDGRTALFSIAKRVKLAAMAQHRKSLISEATSKKQAKATNFRLLRAVWLHHDTIENPEDKAINPTAHDDWCKLRDRPREGRLSFAVLDIFGGEDAFLALLPQLVPDRHIVRIPAKVFKS